ncbi:MAG: ABC transporter ATP-binding protein [Candidatus Promineifilaceae bacterium]|nr:ABC transporter ATP-binding protein [Candidatus Promineifilaceae bacterium]
MTPLLRVEGVSKRFSGLVAVNQVSLDLLEGEILGLIGPNGAGKTTLFNIISGRLAPTAGKVTFDGQVITGMPPHRVCALGVARTFQIARPFSGLTVLDNVKVGAFLRHRNAVQAEERALEVIEFTGLGQSARKPASALTAAGRKRLELARALCTEPRLLLLDEVMAGLTATESGQIVDLIHAIRDTGVTILVIEHVMKAIMRLSDRIAVLHHGELIAVDTPQSVAGDERVIEAYLGEEYTFAAD